jgi:hypothetical protein
MPPELVAAWDAQRWATTIMRRLSTASGSPRSLQPLTALKPASRGEPVPQFDEGELPHDEHTVPDDATPDDAAGGDHLTGQRIRRRRPVDHEVVISWVTRCG